MKWSNIYRGFLMGICEIVPGVSSGTMALLLGIYEKYIESLSQIASKEYKKGLKFLIPLILGMGISIVTMFKFVQYLLVNHPIPTHWLFIGLILGVIPMLLSISDYKLTFKPIHYVIFSIVLMMMIGLAFFRSEDPYITSLNISAGLIIHLFLSGMIGATVMLLPGISGSLILLILGAYYIISYSIDAFLSLNLYVLPVLIATGLGILTGVLLGSRLIKFLLNQFTTSTYAVIIGLVIGSVIAIYPGLPDTFGSWVATCVSTVAGFLMSYFMGKVDEKKIPEDEVKS